MKYLPNIKLITGALLLTAALPAQAQTDSVRVKPEIKYTADHPTYVIGGIRIEFVTSMFGDAAMMALHILAVPVSVIWIVAIINAVNLIDGLDGLAAGVSGISAATLAICALMNGSGNIAVLCLTLVGACAGFLIYNFHPASIFMGDTGSMFLGYTLAVLSIMGTAKGVTFVSVFIPILALGIPIFDTLFAILRRMMANKPIFEADKAHLHHRLMARGLSHRNTVLLIYAISVGLSVCAIIVNELTSERGFVVMVLVVTLLLIGANKIGILGSTTKKNKNKGIKITFAENGGCNIDIAVMVKYGNDLKSVAEKIQQSVRSNVESMAQLEIKEINIHIDGIVFAPQKPADTKSEN